MKQTLCSLITGASSGIGTAFAKKAAEVGHDVILNARREERLVALAAELESTYNIKAHIVTKDLSKTGSAEALMAEITQRGLHVDVLINNAGYSIPQHFTGVSLEAQKAFLELTITTPVTLSYLCLEHMLNQGTGRIITISSITALSSGGKGHSLYPAGKAFLVKFSQSLAAEYASKGLRSTAVLPGFVKTEFQSANGMDEKMAEGPTGRFAQSPEAVAEEAWNRNERGAEIVVPGIAAKTMAACMRYLPERLLRSPTRRAAEQYYIGDE